MMPKQHNGEYGKQVLAYSLVAGINSTVLTKANLPKGRDAKLPVYGYDLGQRGRRIPGFTMHPVAYLGLNLSLEYPFSELRRQISQYRERISGSADWTLNRDFTHES